METPLLSVCVITYQHANFIKDCLDSVLAQKTDFPFEIIIGEDDSNDGTRAICQEYADKFPDKIRLFLRSRNEVIYIDGRPTGKFNFTECLLAARGKYISICEGDDYWTDAYKLQRQVGFLESNTDYVGCFHNVEERFEDDDTAASFLYCYFPSARNISFEDLTYKNQMPTCSVVFRNKLAGKLPGWYFKIRMGDWPLHLLNAQFGDFWYIPKIMAVHRLHKASAWMLQDADRNRQYVIDAYDIMIKGFDHDKLRVEELKKGRESFITSIKVEAENQKNGYKKRVKNLIKRVIDKL